MKVIYDRDSDTLSIILRDGKVAESDEARDGLILDYDKAGRLVSLELLDASEQIKQPESIEFALGARNQRYQYAARKSPPFSRLLFSSKFAKRSRNL